MFINQNGLILHQLSSVGSPQHEKCNGPVQDAPALRERSGAKS